MLIAIYKSAAKLLQIFGIRKDLHKKTHPKMRFLFPFAGSDARRTDEDA